MNASEVIQLILEVPVFLRSLGVICSNKNLPERVRKSIQGLVCPKLTAHISALELFLTLQMIILSVGCKPNNFQSHKSLKLSFINIQGLYLNFAEYESPPLTFLLLCETILDDWSDSGNFSVWSHLPLIQKDSVTHIHKLAVYMKEGFPFAQNLSLPKSADSYLCFQQDLLHSVPCFCLSITSLVFRWCYVRSGVRPIDSAMKWTDFTPRAEQSILQTKKLSYLIFSLYVLCFLVF